MNRVVHFEIPADDMERAKRFYSENFGWKLIQLGPEMGSYVLVQTGPTDDKGMPQDAAFINGGLMKRDASASSPVLVIAVDDADLRTVLARADLRGGRGIQSEDAGVPAALLGSRCCIEPERGDRAGRPGVSDTAR